MTTRSSKESASAGADLAQVAHELEQALAAYHRGDGADAVEPFVRAALMALWQRRS